MAAETVGFVLSVLPLLISAAEHYEDCLQPFVRYRNFNSELDRFQQRLKIQKTVFLNECRILLESAVEHEVATRMLDDSSHPQWQDAIVDTKLIQQLNSSKDACMTVISQIKEQLVKVEKHSQDFEIAVRESGQGSFADKAWRRRVGKKIKFCFSKSRLADHLEDLKALNDEFRTLSAQTFILEAARNQKVSETSCKLSRDIEKFRLIQKASQKVYEALGRSCTKHTEHLTHFCLDAVAVDNGPSPQVQFKLAFTHLTLQGSLSSADPVWFMVESIIGNNTGESVQLSQASVGLVQTLKRSGDLSNEPSNKKPKKSVHFQSRAPSSIPYPIVSTEPEVPLTNLCMRKNFCDQLRGWFQRSPQEHRCLGTLDDTDCYKHLIYFPPPTFNYGRRPATSLEHVISTLSQQGPQGRFSQRDRIHLAYSLATAVLRYHATPWLKGSWRSDDIYFFDFDEKAAIEQQPNLSPPHLRVSVKGPDSALSRTSTFPPRDLAANSLLFGLGVLLIEIGYTATLKSLQRPSDIRDVENKFTEYYVAKRLASSIAREMGTAYGKIVKKCLQCDFGCGDDLNEPELQAGFHRDVVKELKRLEDELGDLHLGP